MELAEILSNLCYYDKRNPDCDTEDENHVSGQGKCYCDNCFYGRTKMAEEILRLREITK